MKYTEEVDIGLPRAKVVELFDNSENWPKWQETLVSSAVLEGSPGKVGAKTRLVHKFGRRETAMVETIESKNLPDEMSCIYEAPGAWNRVVNRFGEAGVGATRWELESEFRCTGFLRIMAFLLPGMFRKATRKSMTKFKSFAESAGQGPSARGGS